MLDALIEAILGRARSVLAVLVILLLFGIQAYVSIPKESNPDVKIPIMLVMVAQEGISPEDAERLMIKPLETKLRNIQGVKQLQGIAYEGGAYVMLEFFAGFNNEKALADIREKVDAAKSEFPPDAREPQIEEISFSQFPVLIVKLSGPLQDRALFKIARDLKDSIESQVKSVLKATIVGNRDEAVEIILDPIKMDLLNVTLETLWLQFQRNHLIVSAGNLDTGQGRFSIKVPGYIETVEELYDFPLKVQGDAVVKLKDIALIHKTFKDPIGFARDRGRSAVTLEVSKRSGENIIDTIHQIRTVVAAEQKRLPSSLKIDFAQDDSKHIEEMLTDLQNSLIIAVFLVMVVIVASLGWRSSLLVGIAVPGSFLSSILFLYLIGLTVNIVVLFSLILSVGMLVDGAIIVVEYADRKMAEGFSPREAYFLAAKRMFWPVVTSTVTILVVFFPLLFWPGVVGQFMKYLPITLLATLIASIFMALIFVPVLGAYFGRLSPEMNAASLETIAASEMGDFSQLKGFTGAYVQLLDRLLDHPVRVIAGAVGVLMTVFGIYLLCGRGVEFFPDVEPDQAMITIHGRGNLSVFEKDALVRQVESRIVDIKDLASIYAHSGDGGSKQQSRQQPAEDQIGEIVLEFVDWQKRRKVDAVLEDIAARTKNIPGIRVETVKNKSGPAGGKPIQIQLSAKNPAHLHEAYLKIRQYMQGRPGLTSLEDNASVPGIEWQFHIDRAQAAKFGADVALLGATIRLVTNGYKLGTYRPGDNPEEVDILVRYPESYRTLEGLKNLHLQTTKGSVPIGAFVTRKAATKVHQIHRTDGGRVILLQGDVKPGILPNEEVKALEAWVAQNPLHPEVKLNFKGEQEQQQETGRFLMLAFTTAVLIIALILITQFNSYFNAFLVLSAVVMSTMGVLVGLLVTGQAFGIVMGGIGVIALAGIIVSNNIIFIDTFDQLQTPTSSIRDIILRTGAQRLRPVILTKLTTILGLLPMMLKINIDFVGRNITIGAPATQWWVQLSTAIVFGVLFASSLTLIVTPCALMARQNFLDWLKSTREEKDL